MLANKVQQYIKNDNNWENKRIQSHYDPVSFVSRIEWRFNMRKLTRVFHSINRLKEKIYRFISNSEKLMKFNTFLMTLVRRGDEGDLLNLKNISTKASFGVLKSDKILSPKCFASSLHPLSQEQLWLFRCLDWRTGSCLTPLFSPCLISTSSGNLGGPPLKIHLESKHLSPSPLWVLVQNLPLPTSKC